MKASPPRFLHLAAGAAALRPRVAHRDGRKPIRRGRCVLIVGFPPGGVADILARLIGQWLSERLGQPFVIENRPGAGGNIATEVVVRAPPDGYTLLMVSLPHAINATLYDKLNFNFIRDIAPVASIMRAPGVMVVNPSVPAKTVPEFIAYAKANPGKINMASAGNGTTAPCLRRAVQVDDRGRHGARAISRRRARDYRPARRAGTGLLRPHSESIEHIRAGRLRPLAVTTAVRVRRSCRTSRPWPNSCRATRRAVGTGSARPRIRPREIIEKLNKEINAALADPKMKARLADLGGTVLAGSPADFGKFIADETEKWAKVIKFAGIKPE